MRRLTDFFLRSPRSRGSAATAAPRKAPGNGTGLAAPFLVRIRDPGRQAIDFRNSAFAFVRVSFERGAPSRPSASPRRGTAELVDLRQLVGRVELLFLARPGRRDVDAREDPPVEEPAIQDDLAVPVPLNSSKMTSSIRLPVSTRQVAMIVSEPPSSCSSRRRRSGAAFPSSSRRCRRRGSCRSALLVVVRAAHPGQRVAEDHDVLADLHEPLGPLEVVSATAMWCAAFMSADEATTCPVIDRCMSVTSSGARRRGA